MLTGLLCAEPVQILYTYPFQQDEKKGSGLVDSKDNY